MSAGYLGINQGIPLFLSPRMLLLQERERWRKAIFLADKLQVVRPGGGVAPAHFQNIYNHGVDCGVGVTPYIV